MTKKNSGFTILEVLIATLIFSIVLLLCMQAVTRIGYLYYKGVTSAQVQDLTRQLSDEIVQQIQFGSRPPSGNVQPGDPDVPLIFCVGDNRYRATLNREMGVESTTVLLREPIGGTGECDPDDNFGSGAVELASRGMRIQNLSINRGGDGNVWSLTIRVGIGGTDLYEGLETAPDSGIPNDDVSTYTNAICRSGISGAQFCATSELQSSLLRRINVE